MRRHAPRPAGGPAPRGGNPPGAAVVELSSSPSLARLYARGLVGSARLAAASRGEVSPEDLPRTQVIARGLTTDADHLTAYQHLVGEPAGDTLPAGFVHVLAFPVATALMVRSDFPLPLLGLVHIANRVEVLRPVLLGETLDVHVTARDLTAHRAGVTVDVVVRVEVGGQTVWRGASTYLAKGVRLRDTAEPTDQDTAERVVFEPPVPTGLWRLGADVGRRYARVSGDRNPIHLSAFAAKAFGFPRTIAHGMYTAARALADVGPARGPAFAWDVEFAKPVLLPSAVNVRVAAHGAGHEYVGWDSRGRKHFSGAVLPLHPGD